MKTTIHSILTIAILSVILSFSSSTEAAEKKLIMYCGATMKRPVAELAKEFEEETGCAIEIKTGGSGNLLSELVSTKTGDLFLPGSDSYVAKAEKKGLVAKKALVGYNKAAMMVQKGNPKGIPATLDSLSNPSYRVIIGNPKSGSIGKETRKILKKKGNYKSVIKNAVDLATASNYLIEALKEDHADLTINWYATSTWSGNSSFITVLPIKGDAASKKKLVLAILSFSQNQEMAEKFLQFAASEHGKATFNKYGLYDIE